MAFWGVNLRSWVEKRNFKQSDRCSPFAASNMTLILVEAFRRP